MKNSEEIFLATARTLSENSKVKINFKNGIDKIEKNSDYDIDLKNNKNINRGTLDYSCFFERFLQKSFFYSFEPEVENLRNMYKYLHYARAHCLAIIEFPGVLVNLKTFNRFLLKKKKSVDNPEDLFFFRLYTFCLEKFLNKKMINSLPVNSDLNLFCKKNLHIIFELKKNLKNHENFSKISRRLCEKLSKQENQSDNKKNQETQINDTIKKEKGSSKTESKKLKKFYFEKKKSSDSQKDFRDEPLGGGKKIKNFNRTNSYKSFTNKFDKITYAEKLCDKNEISNLRQKLLSEFPKLDHVVRKLATKLEKKLLSKQTRSWDYNLEEGILDVSRLSRRVINPLENQIYKLENDSSAKNTIVTLLIDNSGSMRGRPIITAVNAVEVLTKTLEKCGVKIEILGFTTKEWKGGQSRKFWKENSEILNPGRLNDLLHIIYKDSEKSWKTSNKNLGLVLKEGLLKENIDGEALLWAEKRLLKKSERKKVLIVISDGAPVDDSTLSANDSNILEEHLKEVILKIEKKKVIDLLAIGIGHDVSKYYSRAITIDDANKLAEVMLQKLTGIFSKN